MIDFTKLDPDFNEKLQQLITNMQYLGHTVDVTCGIRSIEDECRIFRRSRPTAVIEELVKQLQDDGAPYVASVLKGVGPQPTGPWGTNTLSSYHVIGRAADMIIDGNTAGDAAIYDILSDHCTVVGLVSGETFSGASCDPGHVQLGEGNLMNLYTWPELDAIIKNIDSQ